MRQYFVMGGRLFVTGPLAMLEIQSISFVPLVTSTITNYNLPNYPFKAWKSAPPGTDYCPSRVVLALMG